MTEPDGDTTPGTADAEAQEVVTDVFSPDGNRQDFSSVVAQPERQNISIVDDPGLSPEVASAAAAEIEAAELGDAASQQYEGGDSAPDPQ
ncbi:hypothetical protein [Trujillonella endophytica]|uniref:Large subunit ribosomal protein L17 n=1 Tax=Trujillonella endophytica TaxID=673521 RepID=A0A1H8RNI3_9ACTN|nr:hypothetical protein [Trujillella endophytica]SEO67847.1 large subunit ribosomal protein L17 [Trujillella endophytica]